MNEAGRDTRDHRLVWDLIPWVVNGTASGEQCQQVQAHVALCDDCRRELEFQQSLQAALAEPVAGRLDAEAALRKIRPQLEEIAMPASATVAAGAARVRRRRGRTGAWRLRERALLAAVIIEAVALAALGNAWWLQMRSPRGDAPYQVLSAGTVPASPATIRAVFSPGTSMEEMQALLHGARLQIVAGPSEAGVYSLGPAIGDDPAARRAALALLRSSPQVRFAEPVSDPPKSP